LLIIKIYCSFNIIENCIMYSKILYLNYELHLFLRIEKNKTFIFLLLEIHFHKLH